MQIIDSFELSAKKPLDARQMWDSLEDLQANTATLMPIGFLAYCRAEGAWYQLKSATDESDPTTYVWTLQQTDTVAIQVSSLPVITDAAELANWADNTFYQYTGATNAEYHYGYFYALDQEPSVKTLEVLPTDVVSEITDPDTGDVTYSHSISNYLGMIVAHTDADSVVRNYKCTAGAADSEQYTWEVTAETPEQYYNWRNVAVQDSEGQVIQVGTTDTPVPVAAPINANRVVQYVGTTNSTMRNCYFYKCVNQTFYAYNDKDESAPVTTIYVNDNPIRKNSKIFLKNVSGEFENFDYTYTVTSAVMENGNLVVEYTDGTDDYSDTFTADSTKDETVWNWKEVDTQPTGEDREALLKTNLVASVAVGGIEEGTTIKEDAPLEVVLRKILCPATPPEFTFAGTPAAGLVKNGTAVTTPTLTVTCTSIGSNTARSYKIVKIDSEGTETEVVADTPLAVNTFNHITEDNLTTTTTYACIVSYTDDDGLVKTVSKTVKYEFVDPSFYGISNTATVDAAAVKAMTERLSKAAKYEWTGINMTNQRVCYAYPASYGALTNIVDENNFKVISSFNVLDLTIDDVAYKVYITKDTATLVNGKLIFS